MLALLGFIAMVVMLLPHVSPKKKQTEEHHAPGNVIVEMHWPNDMPVDVDLWVRAPGDSPVGFFNQGGKVFNLLRDDLGFEGDASNLNYEVSYSRGIPPGEYVANVHMYGVLWDGKPVPVRVIVSVKKPREDTVQILQTEVTLNRHNQEITAFRFRLNEDSDLVPGSVSTLHTPLITGR